MAGSRTRSEEDEMPGSRRIFHRISTEIKVLSNFLGISDVCLEMLRNSKN